MFKHRKLAALPMKLHVGRTLAVVSQQMTFVNHNSRVVQITPAQFVEAHNEGYFKLRGLIKQLHDLRRIDRKRISSSNVAIIRISGEEAFREARDVNAIRISLLQAFEDFAQIAFEVSKLRIKLTVSNSHGYSPRVSLRNRSSRLFVTGPGLPVPI